MKITSIVFLLIVFSIEGICQEDSIAVLRKLYSDYLTAKEQGNFFSAKSYLEEILSGDYISSDNDKAVIYNGLATIWWNLGYDQKAKTFYIKALDYCNSSSPLSIENKRLIYNNLAILYNQSGDYNTALITFQQVEHLLNITSDKNLEYYRKLSTLRFNEALVYIKIEQYDASITRLNESRVLKENYHFSYLGSVYFNLARCYWALNKVEEADLHYVKSINQWTKEYDSSYYQLANIYLDYGQFLIEQGMDSLGISYFEKALESYLINYGRYHPYTASAYQVFARYYLRIRNFEKAFENIQLALASISPGFQATDIFENPDSPNSLLDLRLLKIYTTKIEALEQYSDEMINQGPDNETGRSAAVAYLELANATNMEALQILNRIQQSYLSQESRLYLAENRKDIFLSGIRNALKLNQLTGNTDYQNLAYYFASVGKSMELRYELNRKKEMFLKNQGDSTAASLTALQESMDSYTNLIEMEQMKRNADSSKIRTWQEEKYELTRSYEKAYRSVFGQEMDTVGFQPFTDDYVSDIQARTGRRYSCMEYTLSDPDEAGSRLLYTFLINRKGLFIRQSVLNEQFAVNLECIEKNLYEFDPMEYSARDQEDLDRSLEYFYNTLITPLQERINGHRIIVIPDAELAFVPFGALMPNKEDPYLIEDPYLVEDSDHIEASYLIEAYEISYGLNAQQISKSRDCRLSGKPTLGIFAYNFDDVASDAIASTLPELATAEQEAEAILELMPGKRIGNHLGKEQVLEEIKHADMLHFALHASPSNTRLSSSFLALSEDFDSSYSNLLFDYEIEPLRLNTELVVLNACSSGGGILFQGNGLFSLSRSFLLGGTKAVIQTQWPINDRTSSAIITRFYKELSKGTRKTKALRKAQLQYLESAFPAFRHPYYWAAYQMVGDNSPVSANRKAVWLLTGIGLPGVILVFAVYRRKKNRLGDKRLIS